MTKGISLVDINKEMRESYLQYSMSVIVGRALPDVRDGLKPVHRRILFAMKDLNNTHDKPFKKSARVVGDVIGKYHPHGEMAVYDAIVRMAQDFSMQAPLIDGQGNFGSIDGDSAAASRYTEIRMTALAEELLTDIDKQTVPFGSNYDNSLSIPLVLPARYPNLLVNGSSGIAVGMSCNIPPHNLGEVVSGCLLLLENPEVTIPELMNLIPGPDFPTSGIIEGKEAIYAAYTKGRGIITVSSVAEIEEREKQTDQIVITELPYQVNKARLIESIANLVKDKKVEGISDIRDESSREGLRIAIPLKRGANPQIVLKQLQKHSQLKTSFGIIFLSLDKNNQPRIFNLKEMLVVFIEHRIEIITHRLIFDLKKAQEKLHILEGLEKALEAIDKVITIIKGSPDGKQAQKALILELQFSHRQAQAILDMRLQKLTGLETKSLKKDRQELDVKAKNLKEILSSEEKIKQLLKEELEEIKTKYERPRRTQIIVGSEEISDRDLITKQDVILFLTYKGLVKRIPLEEYRVQKRGGKGLKGWDLRNEGDFVWKLWSVHTLQRLLVFSSMGRLHWLDVYRVPSGLRQSKARSLNNLLSFKDNEEPRLVLPLNEKLSDKAFISTITKKGIVKKSRLSLFSRPRVGGVYALTIDEGDFLQDVQTGDGHEDFLIYTRKGLVIRTKNEDVRETGRVARGVIGIRLRSGDHVVSMEVIDKNKEDLILVITENGYGKRVKTTEFRTQNRGGKGVLGQKITKKTGEVICARLISNENQALITTNQGQSIRFPLSGVSIVGRNSQGVRFINLKEGERVTGATIVSEEKEETGSLQTAEEKNIHEVTLSEADKAASSEADKEASGEADKAASSEADKEASSEADKEASGEADKEASSEADKEASGEADKEASSEADKEASGEADKEASGEADKEASSEADKEASGEADKEASSEADKEASGEADKEASSEADKEASSEADKEARAQSTEEKNKNSSIKSED